MPHGCKPDAPHRYHQAVDDRAGARTLVRSSVQNTPMIVFSHGPGDSGAAAD